jgi:nucleoside-diphosphate-sugar epimerase
MRLVADISRIVREVGWQPRTDLKEGLAQTIPFYERTRAIWVGQPV